MCMYRRTFYTVPSSRSFSAVSLSRSLFHSAPTFGWVSILMKIFLYASFAVFRTFAAPKTLSILFLVVTICRMGRLLLLPLFVSPSLRWETISSCTHVADYIFSTFSACTFFPSRISCSSGTPSITKFFSLSLRSGISRNSCCFVMSRVWLSVCAWWSRNFLLIGL